MPSKTDIIESLLFASDKPVPLKKLAQVVELSVEEAQAELDVLREEKERIGALLLIEVAGGWQIVTKPAFSPFIRQLRDAPKQRLSRAAFEVLAIVAYRQPVTRSDVEALRGVDCSGPVQFLLEKKLITFAGRKEAPGRPHLYGTTPEFLELFGLRDLSDLPSLEELTELNGGTLIHEGDRLFNRGEMQAMVDDDATEASAESGASAEGDGAETAAGDKEEDSAVTVETADGPGADTEKVDAENPVEGDAVPEDEAVEAGHVVEEIAAVDGAITVDEAAVAETTEAVDASEAQNDGPETSPSGEHQTVEDTPETDEVATESEEEGGVSIEANASNVEAAAEDDNDVDSTALNDGAENDREAVMA